MRSNAKQHGMTRPISNRQRPFGLMPAFLFALLVSSAAFAQAPSDTTSAAADTSSAAPPDSGSILPADTTSGPPLEINPFAMPGGLSPDSLLSDTLAVDSVAVDTARKSDSLRVPVVEPWVILQPDTTAPPPPDPVALTLDNRDFARHGYKDAGEIATIAPGLFPHQTQLYSQPFYPLPPGGSGRDLTVLYRGRSYDDPLTDATNFATYAPEEIQQFHLSQAWSGAGPASSGPVAVIDPPFAYPRTPMTRVVYRQGFYGLGHADWRIAQQVTDDFAYHIGVDIGEYRGRFAHTAANNSMLRVGGRQQIRDVGLLQLYWMETRETHGRPFDSGTSNTHRNDIDLILSQGRPFDPTYREAALWYVRSQQGYHYGDNDGNRLGARLVWEHDLADSQRVHLRADLERTAARFARRPEHPDPFGQRMVAGLTALDELHLPSLRAQAAVRTEWAAMQGRPDTTAHTSRVRIGGAFTADWGDTLGPGLLAELSSSWRWPSLDEAYGYWSLRSPDRAMDPMPVPDEVTRYYRGNAALAPQGSQYGGAGVRFRQGPRREVRVLAGVRRWGDPIETRYLGNDNYTRANGPSFTSGEVTGMGWLDLFAGFSGAAAWTWSNGVDNQDPVPSLWGWSSLRFDHVYFNGELRIRANVTARYWGEYTYLNRVQPSAWSLDGLLTARIAQFELFFGNDNILGAHYALFPGYPFMHRSEVWGVRWTLWN